MEEVYDIKELLKRYPHFTMWTVNEAIKKQNLPVIRIGRRRFFAKDSIETWLKSLERRG